MRADVVIKAEGVSKRYVLQHRVLRGQGLRHVIDGLLTAPSKWFSADRAEQAECDFYALRDVSFEVSRGEVLGIVGRNGAGKSTLLKILSRITEPTQGRVGVKGRMASLLEVGTGFHPELTGRENIYLNGAILGMRRAEIARRFDEIVAFAEIDHFLDMPLKRYSSGMYARLAFSVAAHLEPDVLAIDEVLSVGDVSFQRKCLGKMSDVAQADGRTVLFVSHNLPAVQRMCSRAILLERGSILEVGKPADVIAAYLSLESTAELRAPIRGRQSSILIRSTHAGEEPIFIMGQPAELSIVFEVDRPVTHASVGIGVESSSGERVVTFDTTLQHPDRWRIERRARLLVEWPECILAPGRYRFVAALYDGGRVVDAWHYAGELTVLESDYFGTGQLPEPSHQGKVVTRAHWRIEELPLQEALVTVDRAQTLAPERAG